MYLTYLLLFLFATSICNVNGQSECTTPSGGKGQCISIHECDSLLKLVNNKNRTQQELQLLQNSKCGYQGKTVQVCCPADCTTPDGKFGRCVSIYSCAHLANRLRLPISTEDILFVRNLKCEGTHEYSVCCGTDTGATTTSTTNVVARCTTQQSSFPPDPKSECCGRDASSRNKIIGVGGNITLVDQYPWLVPIKYRKHEQGGNNFLCGGVLISSRYVLTAAHCIGDYTLQTIGTPIAVSLGDFDISHSGEDCMEVEAGGSDCTEGEVVVEIEKLIPHPEYTARSRKNDIGLIKLARNAPYTDFIRPICLPTNDIALNPPSPPERFPPLYVAGWGATENSTYSTLKLHVGLPYVDLNECQKAYSGPVLQADLWDRQICAGGQRGKDSCRGDSGGPLMYENGRNFEVVGVVNFGPKPCGQANFPGVYAKVYSYLEWIHSTIAANG